jgi:hypothetical protein
MHIEPLVRLSEHDSGLQADWTAAHHGEQSQQPSSTTSSGGSCGSLSHTVSLEHATGDDLTHKQGGGTGRRHRHHCLSPTTVDAFGINHWYAASNFVALGLH